MAKIRSKGLSFHKRREKVTLTGAKSVILLIGECIIALFIAFVLVYVAGMQVKVVGNSMSRTLMDGETVLVNRFVYTLTDPKPGDVVVFLPNGNEKSHYYVKRVVGVPGDTVWIDNGILYVNGEMFDQDDVAAIENPGLAAEPMLLDVDEYFVIGDDRNSGEDSRYTNIGNISEDYIVGKAWFHIRSIHDIGFVK